MPNTLRALLSHRAIVGGLDFFRTRADRVGPDDVWISYGRDLDTVPDLASADVVGHRHLAGSDYVGGSLVRANLRAVREDIPLGDFALEARGALGTVSALFRLDVESEHAETAAEILEALADYPVVSDDVLSELEHEEEHEAFTDYGARDMAKEIARVHELELCSIDDGDTLGELFAFANESDGALVVHEESGCYLDTDRAVERLAPIIARAKREEIPLGQALARHRAEERHPRLPFPSS
jgi:hypothetical protein